MPNTIVRIITNYKPGQKAVKQLRVTKEDEPPKVKHFPKKTSPQYVRNWTSRMSKKTW